MLTRLRQKNLHTWMRGYAHHLVRRARTPRVDGPRHLLFAMCDHYEPLWAGAPVESGRARVAAWREGYPALARGFRDADGRPPRHSFFFPGEEYQPAFLDDLAALARAGLGEVEIHMHHDGDTAASLRAKMAAYLDVFAGHGHLSRAPGGGYQWAFIHGNWCLANGRPDRKWCGVDDELPLLWDLGCYADFTFPSAPDPCQSDMVNLIYWPVGDLARRRSYDDGEPAQVGVTMDDRLLLMTGPLALVRKGRGLRIENGALTGDDPPTPGRADTWVEQGIHVAGRPEWVFVKVHTHGAIEKTAASLLGADGRALHEHLTTRYNDGTRWRLHYVTAREMYNVARAAMDGKGGEPGLWRDYVVPPPPVAVA